MLRKSFGQVCFETRVALDLSQTQLAARAGVTRSYIGQVERGDANITLDRLVSVASALGIEVAFDLRPPTIIGRHPGQSDIVHAWCSGHADRRLRADGWSTAREVEVVHGRSHGWIDLLAFDHRTGTLLIIEIKTRLDDLGAVERQIAWYERMAWGLARDIGWEPRRVATWLLVLASDEVDASLRINRSVIDRAFPSRAVEMTAALAVPERLRPGARGLALIDPAGHGRRWLIRSRLDGRRTPARYADYAAAAARVSGQKTGARRR